MNKKKSLSDEIYEFHLKLSEHPQMRIFNYEEYKKHRDILAIAYGIFRLEKLLKKNKISEFHIERFVKDHKNKLNKLLSELVAYVLLEYVDIKFFNSKKKLNKKKFDYKKSERPKASFLFSGGIDSFSGILWAQEYFNNVEGIFCAHSDQKWIIHLVNSLSEEIFSPAGIKLKTVYVPSLTATGYSQLRGFLYMISAGAWMELLNSDTLVISECGPTMYQPRFAPFDIVTMTTHPVVVEIAHQVLELLLEKKIKIITPFENMTKAEVIALSKFKDKLRKTHSCISQRLRRHDGTCYGCIIRRLGAITAGVEDVKYMKNPITDDKAQKENLLSLLMFSLDILTDYKDMPLYQIENIESYNKLELFKRFALDNFAAIYLLKKKGYSLSREVKNMLEECLKEISEDILNKRIESVRNKNFKINLKPI